MYRIAWRSLLTGYTGHGQYIFRTRGEIERHVEELNRNHTGVLTHWIESDDREAGAAAQNQSDNYFSG